LPKEEAKNSVQQNTENKKTLNLNDIKNATYFTAENQVTFKDGKAFGWAELNTDRKIVYHFGETKNATTNGWDFEKGIERIAVGDLDNDGKEDAAVTTYDWEGGTGYFKSLTVLLNKDNKPVYLTSIDLGDRTAIDSISINLGAIRLAVTTHGSNDPLCCPTLNETWDYKLVDNKLIKIEDQTIGWETYTNTQYGFEIKYSSELKKCEDFMGREGEGIFCKYFEYPSNTYKTYYGINILDEAKGIEIIQQRLQCSKNKCYHLENKIINNIEFYYGEDDGVFVGMESWAPLYFYIAKVKDKSKYLAFYIHGFYRQKWCESPISDIVQKCENDILRDKIERETIDKMLYTFKFLP
jgi:hypothetical protein